LSTPGRILVDTSVWIDFFSSRPGPAGAELRRLIADAAPVAFTGIIVTEILEGLIREAEKVADFLAQFDLRAAELFRQARSRGLALTTVDAWIAALALEHAAQLFTLDLDFVRLAKFVPLELYSFG